MYITLESFKNTNNYVFNELGEILMKLQDTSNPYDDIDISPWRIDNKPNIKHGFNDNLSFVNIDKKENILVYFETEHET